MISIHAPRAGSDGCVLEIDRFQEDFNPRSPCGERRKVNPHDGFASFISIHAPRAGSDPDLPSPVSTSIYFNPRSPCGERRSKHRLGVQKLSISIHAPRAGSDQIQHGLSHRYKFQSTLPVRGATSRNVRHWFARNISIHAPRAGSDIVEKLPRRDFHDFNPRSPCGERQQYIVLLQVQSAIYTQSAILSIVNAIKGRRLLIEFGAKACGISCVLQIRTHKTSGSSTEIVSFEP